MAHQDLNKTSHSRDKVHTALWLGYAGILPFVAMVLALFLLRHEPSIQFVLVQAFILYSALIVTFLAGALWAESLVGQTFNDARLLLLASNVVMLISWGCLLLSFWLSIYAQLLILASLYLALLSLERCLANLAFKGADNKQAYTRYGRMRCILTAMVVACHGLLMFILAY